MTIDEFNETNWRSDMLAKYRDHDEYYPIIACDFDEALIGLEGLVSGTDEPTWVRCENIEIVDY